MPRVLQRAPRDEFLERITLRSQSVGVIGVGDVGLPFSIEFVADFEVLGFDVDARCGVWLLGGQNPTIT